MNIELSDELLNAVLNHISEHPNCSAKDIRCGEPEAVLLALRHLRWKGLITDGFACDPQKIGNDQGGGYLENAIMLTVTGR